MIDLMGSDKILNDLSGKEKYALYKMSEHCFNLLQHPKDGGYPSPANTKNVLVNAIAAAYLAGREGDLKEETNARP